VTTVSVSVDVDGSADATWALVTDWERQGEWMPMTSVVLAPGTGHGLGARLTARSGVGRAAVTDPMVVDVWEPPTYCEVVHQGRVVTGRGVFRVEPLGVARSRFTWQEVLDSRGPRRILDRAAGPPTKLLLGVAVRRLARLVAAESA
jgi:Polyketide cyclase / dehydrase and lipid transport